jgi:hypothetical protein
MRVEKGDVGLDVVAAAESSKFLGGAPAIENAHGFPGADFKHPTGFRVVRAPHVRATANLDTAETSLFERSNT